MRKIGFLHTILDTRFPLPYMYIVGNVALLGLMSLYHYYQPVSPVLTAVAWLIFAVSAFRQPHAAFVSILLSVMLFERWFALDALHVGGAVLKLYSLDIALGIVFLAVVVPRIYAMRAAQWFRLIAERVKAQARWQKTVHWLVLWWALYITCIGLMHAAFGGSFGTLFSAWKNYAFYSVLYVFAVYFYAISNEAKDHIRIAIHTILGGGLLLFIFPIIGIMQGQGVWAEFTPLSTSGVRLVAATHTFFLSMLFIAAVALRLEGSRVHDKLRRLYLNPYFTIVLICFMLIGMYRNVWVGMGITVFALSILLHRAHVFKVRDIVGPAVAFGVMLAVLGSTVLWYYGERHVATVANEVPIVTSIGSRLQSALSVFGAQYDESSGWRVTVWRESIEYWTSGTSTDIAKNVLFGTGLGTSITFTYNNFLQDVAIKSVHNDWLSFMVQGGIFALVFMVAIVSVMTYNGFRIAYRERSAIHAMIAGMIIFFSVAAFFGAYFVINIFGMWFWVLLGLIHIDPDIILKK